MSNPRLVPRATGLVAMLGGSAVLVAWAVGIPALKAPIPGVATMKVNTAIGFWLSGLSLWMSEAGKRPGRGAQLPALAAGVVGFATMVEFIFNANLHIDQLLIADDSSIPQFPPGRMSPVTAVAFVAFAGAVACSGGSRTLRFRDPVALLIASLGGVALIGYLYDVRSLYGVGPFTTMAVHTALLLVVLAVGLFFSHPTNSGAAAFLFSDTVSGTSARRLLPFAIVTPVVVGWLRLMGQRAGLYGTEFGLVIVVVTTIAVIGGVTWVNARILLRMEIDRRNAEANLRELTARKQTEEQFRALLESAPDAMVIVDGDGRIKLVNAQAEHMFGYSRSELVDQPVEMLVPPDLRAAHGVARTAYGTNPVSRRMGQGRDLLAIRKDRSAFPVEVSLSPLQTPDGLLVSSAIRDVTVAKADAQRLRASLVEKEVLLREIHHRVKNNLQLVSSLLNLKTDSVDNADARAALAESQSQVRAMALLHEALYRSDGLAGVDFGEYVQSLWMHLSRTVLHPDMRVRLELQSEPIALDMDQAVPCALIATELLTNALKHGFPAGGDGTIVVELTTIGDGRVRFRIGDNGVGITDAARQAAEGRGSVGLKLVHALAGQLDAVGEWSGPGTVFTMVLQTVRKPEKVMS